MPAIFADWGLRLCEGLEAKMNGGFDYWRSVKKETLFFLYKSMSLKRPRSFLNPLPETSSSHKRPLIESRDKSPRKSTESDFGELKIDDSPWKSWVKELTITSFLIYLFNRFNLMYSPLVIIIVFYFFWIQILKYPVTQKQPYYFWSQLYHCRSLKGKSQPLYWSIRSTVLSRTRH